MIAGVDYVPPLLLRAGRNIGARGSTLYRYVIAPASLPAIVAGLKQGWAFAWRSLMAGELLVIIARAVARRADAVRAGLQRRGRADRDDGRDLRDRRPVDLAFTAADKAVRVRWGVHEAT